MLDPPDQPHVQAVDSLVFHYRGANVPGNLGNGLYFDDVVVENTTGPLACPLALPAVTGSGLMLMGLVFLATIGFAVLLRLRGLPRSVTG